MKVIGYKFESVSDNGDYNEWYREMHLESPIYTTEDAARRSIELCKRKMLHEAAEAAAKYASSQIMCEIRNGRSTNKFLCEVQKGLMNEYKEILYRMRNVKVVPILAEEEPTDRYNEYNIA